MTGPAAVHDAAEVVHRDDDRLADGVERREEGVRELAERVEREVR